MSVLVTDPTLASRLKRERQLSGGDRYDEVWEGIYMMAPMPNNEHQELVTGLAGVLQEVVVWPGRGKVCAGVNLSDRAEDWEHNYRVPDVAVFLEGTRAENCGTHWRGAADLLIEVVSPEDQTRDKLPFYGQLGVRELVVIDRDPWRLELYRLQSGKLLAVGQSELRGATVLASEVVPLGFRLVAGKPRPRIEVLHAEGGRTWLV